MTDQGYSQLKQAILIYAGINLEFYKEQQVKRRLDGYLLRVKASSIDEYCGLLRRDREAAKDLRNFLTIKVLDFVQLGGPILTVNRTIFELEIPL